MINFKILLIIWHIHAKAIARYYGSKLQDQKECGHNSCVATYLLHPKNFYLFFFIYLFLLLLLVPRAILIDPLGTPPK
jgi:hypothetical protein